MQDDQTITWYDDPSHFRRVSRRDFLYVGLVGGLGLTLGDFFKLQAAETVQEAKAKAVINIFLPGGISAQESFDPKPLAAVEYRGPLGTFASANCSRTRHKSPTKSPSSAR